MTIRKYISRTSAEAMVPIVVITVFLTYFFRLWAFNVTVPVSYDGDALLHLAFIKTIIESGWVFSNSHLGAPFGMNFYDFPGSDGVFLILLRFLTVFSGSPFVVFNVFYILGFALIFFFTFWSFRQFRITILLSTAGALIYTCLPYHFLRGVNHLYLATYFIVPLLIVVAMSIYPGCDKTNPTPLQKLRLPHFLILLAGGMCGVYYAFFGIFTIGLTGLIGSVQQKNLTFLRKSIVAILIITTGVFVNLAPTIGYRAVEGTNTVVGQRSPIESEIYGLRMTQLMLPIWGHHSAKMANITHRYQEHIVVTEATSSALGVITGAGFIFLLGAVFFGRSLSGDPRIEILAKLNLASFLFATVAGIGLLFALAVMPEFRGLNRISIFIGFFSLLGVMILIQAWLDNRSLGNRLAKLVPASLAILLILVAIYDQVPAGARGQNPAIEKAFSEDAFFISQIEATVRPGAMIYQLPYLPFPESAPMHDEGYNGLIRPYLHATSTRWSYGAMKGRMGDAWLKELEKLPLGEKLKALESTGFEGLYIERRAYKDHGLAIEGHLRQLLNVPPLVSPSGNNAFYRLNPQKMASLQPSVGITPGAGFYDNEVGDGGRFWVWGNSKAELLLFNFDKLPKRVVLRAGLTSPNSGKVVLHGAGGINETIRLLPGQDVLLDKEFMLKPGKNILVFETDRQAIKIPPDPRDLALRITQPTLDLAKN